MMTGRLRLMLLQHHLRSDVLVRDGIVAVAVMMGLVVGRLIIAAVTAQIHRHDVLK